MNDPRIAAAPVATPLAAAATAPAARHPGNAPPVDTSFQALLERLQRFAAPPVEAAPVATTDELHAAVRAADSTFTTAMDLRHQLEEAFRRHITRP